jgi:uncharacterized protein YggT (Ycf19 family)
MRDLGYRLLVILWFAFYMAAIYLGLHALVARLVRNPESRLLWFFAIVTAPLTRPVRALLPAGTSEARVRLIALAAAVILMIAARALLRTLGGTPLG